VQIRYFVFALQAKRIVVKRLEMMQKTFYFFPILISNALVSSSISKEILVIDWRHKVFCA
jgi:hypothetical protein